MEWNPHPRPPVHAHIVHPSPVRAHSYPFASFYRPGPGTDDELELKLQDEFEQLREFPLTLARGSLSPSPHQYQYSGNVYGVVSPQSQHQRSPYSHAHALPHSSHSRAHTRPQPVSHQWSYSTTSSKSQSYSHANGHAHSYPPQTHSPASIAHDLPSPPLSTTMPDPWGADRSTDEHDHEHEHEHDHDHEQREHDSCGGREVLPPAPPVISPLPMSKSRPPAPKRRLSPLSKRLLAPVTLEVWASLMDKSKGRDKVLKTIQYSLRTYLYVLGLIAAVRPLTRWFMANRKRANQAVAGLSLTRKCLLLMNPLRPAGALLSSEPTSARAFLGHLIELCSAVADDIFCLSKLGLVSKRKGVKADEWANRIWFGSTLVGLWTLIVKMQTPRREEEEAEDDWQLRKYLCDLVFVSYDIFKFQRGKEPVQCIAGLSAALISAGQLYHKEWKLLSKREVAKM